MNNQALHTEMRSVPCERGTLTYLLTRKKVKNVNLRIKSDGRILVSANKRVSTAFIDDFVQRNQGYIFRVLERFQERQMANSPVSHQYISGETFLVLGKYLTLKVMEAARGAMGKEMLGKAGAGKKAAERDALEGTAEKEAPEGAVLGKEAVWTDGETIFLVVKDMKNLRHKENLINDFFKNLQKETFEEICQNIYEAFQEYGIPYPQIKIRRMTSRWGSCQPARGIITLNSRLIEAPRESIEYVVLHEFAHFIHPNHSKDFYAFVANLMPDFKERRGKLTVI